jgi:hypothetical protein
VSKAYASHAEHTGKSACATVQRKEQNPVTWDSRFEYNLAPPFAKV